MSMNNVIDPGDVFRDLTSSDTASISSEEVDRLADQLTSTTENIRSLITRQRSQRTPPPSPAVSSVGGELEDIAKQIADHAETLYQTWRARGLTPNEVLRSHNTMTLNSEAAQTLSQRLRDGSKTAMISRHHSLSSSSQSSARSLGALRSSSVPVPSDQPPSPFSASSVFSGTCSPRLSSMDHISQRMSTSPTPASNPVVRQEHTIPIRIERSSSDPPSVNGFSRTPPNTSSLVSAAPLVRQQQAQHKQQTVQQPVPSAPISPVDLLASPDNDRTLEEMVKSFVQEDKARRSSSASSVLSMSSHRFFQKSGSNISSGGLPLQLNKPFHDGYRTLPVKSSSEDATGLVGTSLSRLQVTTNGGETQVLHDRTGRESVGGAWKPISSGSGAAGSSELSVVDEVRRQEQRLRSALLVGAVSSQHPQREISPRPVDAAEDPSAASTASSLSTVDYAKRRLQDPHNQSLAAQRLEDVRSLSYPSQTAGASVQQARSRYDNGQINISDAQWRTDWLPGRHVDPDSGLLLAPAESAWRRKRALLKASAAAAASADHPHQPRTVSPLPHPELTDEQKQHIRERCTLTPTSYNSAGVAIRPFLTQGSVAERVLIFEKCPADLKQRATQDLQERMKQPTISKWRAHNEVKDKAQTYGRDKESVGCRTGSGSLGSPSVSPKPSSPRPDKLPTALNSALIPRFHYPHGRPEGRDKLDSQLTIINQAFSAFPSGQVPKDKFSVITKACGLPRYWKMPLFQAAGGEKLGYVTATVFLDFWKRLVTSCHDPASRFVRVLTAGQRNYLVPEDLVSLLQDVVEAHPGLNFLKEAVEFHSRYIHTVIARIFYCVNRSWSGRITVPELRRSNLLATIQTLEHEEDINQITDFFSYEHFYVIYCKFWELDGDHDLLIDKGDLARHNDHAVSSRIIERIFSGAVTRSGGRKLEKMSYTEFVWFLLSEEDKKHPTAIEYWFRCMDLDGDGVLSMYELEYFYEEQLQRLDALGIDALPFEDCLCWMLDMVQPEQEGRITLSDLKRCRMANVFFDTFFNLEKYLEHDQRDPFAVQRDGSAAHTVSDWDRYAAEEYELLVAEESAAEPDPEFSMYDEEGEDSSMPLSSAPADVEGTTVLFSNPHTPQLEADEADYALVASEECEGQLPHRTVAGMV